MDVPYQPKRTCSRRFREAVENLFPGLGNSYEYWRLLEWLVYSPWHDEETGRLVMSSDVLRHQVGAEDRDPKDWSLNRLLERFGNDVFQVTVGNFGYGRVRTLLSDIPPELVTLIDQELGSVLPRGEERVWFCNGNKVRRQDAADELKRLRADARERTRRVYGDPTENGGAGIHAEARAEGIETIQNHGCQLAFDLLSYLNGLPSNRFDQIRSRLDEAHAVADKVDVDSVRQHQILKSIEDIAQPFYKPVEPDPIFDAKGMEIGRAPRSVRIFSLNDSLLRLKSEVRDVLTKDWMKLDLRAAQLAIVSELWNVGSVKKFLSNSRENDRSIWSELIAWMGVEGDPLAKPMLKDAVYSLVFGMGEKKMKAQLESFFPDLADPWKRFEDHAIIAALLRARTKAFNDMRMQGFGIDAFGQRIPILNKPRSDEGYQPTNVPSAAAIIAQSYELKLLEPVIRLAIEQQGKTGGFVITSWLHDGCWIHVTDSRNRKRWKNRLSLEVEQTAKTLGIPTWLEWDED
ncbi:MAG: hypothetical protein KIS66_00450 [Fimbriimonadaceae bacterium]|nr:hypothetical protein [Fimbriimonadaceae bacterium]